MADGLFGTSTPAPQLRQTALQPAAIPGSTYVRPVQREAGSNMRALAAALGSLNGALSTFAQKREREEKDPNSDLNREWIAKRQLMTAEQLREEAKLGTADGIRAREDALNMLLGEKANSEFRTRWLEFYNTEFDQSLGDASGSYKALREEYAANLPNDISRANFYRLTENHYQSWMEEDTKAKVGFVKEQISTAVVDSFRTAVEDLGDAPATDKAQAIFARSAANRDFLEMSGQEQNDTIYALAAEYALKGDRDLVRALLTGQRTGADGKPLPALSSIPKYATDSLKLIEQAEGVWEKNVKENAFPQMVEIAGMVRGGKFTLAEAEKWRGMGIYTDEELAALVSRSTNTRLAEQEAFAADDAKREQRQQSNLAEHQATVQAFTLLTRYGGVTKIKDIDVIAREGDGYRTVSRDTLIEGAVGMFEDQMAETEAALVERGASPEQAAATVQRQRLAFYSANKLDNEEWKDTLNGIAMRATPEVLLERGAVGEEMLAQANLYRELKASNPAYLNTLLTDPTSKLFLETFDNAVAVRKLPPDAALHYAATVVATPEVDRAKSIIPKGDADKITTDLLKEMGADPRASNFTTVLNRVETLSMGGMTGDEIKKRLREEIEGTSVTINGMLVPDHRDLPDDFPVLMEAELQGAFEVYGKTFGLESAKDLGIVPVSGQSKWQIVDKRTGLPLGHGAYVTPQSLGKVREKRAREHDALVLQTIKAKDAERAEAQRLYDERIQYEKDQIANYRSRKGKLYQGIADYLQGVLDDRLARDAWLRTRTPQQLEKEAGEHLDELQQSIAKQTGLDPSGSGL